MFIRKFLHKLMMVLAIASVHGVTQGASEVILKKQTPWDKANKVKFYAPGVISLGVGLYGLNSILSHGISRQNMYAPVLASGLAVAPAWATFIQYFKRKDQDASNPLWYLAPAATTVGLATLLGAYKNNWLQGLLWGAGLSVPAMCLSKIAADEESMEYMDDMNDAAIIMNQVAKRGLIDQKKLEDSLRIIARAHSSDHYRYTASSEIEFKEINNLIPAYKNIKEPDLQGLLRRIIMQFDASIATNTEDAIKVLQDTLNTNEKLLEENPTAIKEHDFIKLLSLLGSLHKQNGNYTDVGRALSPYSSVAINNLLALIEQRADLLQSNKLVNIDSKYQQIKQFIQDARQAWSDEQGSSGDTSIEILQNMLNATEDISNINEDDFSKLLTALRALKREANYEEVGAVLSNYNQNKINNLVALYRLDLDQYQQIKKLIEDAQNAWYKAQESSSIGAPREVKPKQAEKEEGGGVEASPRLSAISDPFRSKEAEKEKQEQKAQEFLFDPAISGGVLNWAKYDAIEHAARVMNDATHEKREELARQVTVGQANEWSYIIISKPKDYPELDKFTEGTLRLVGIETLPSENISAIKGVLAKINDVRSWQDMLEADFRSVLHYFYSVEPSQIQTIAEPYSTAIKHILAVINKRELMRNENALFASGNWLYGHSGFDKEKIIEIERLLKNEQHA